VSTPHLPNLNENKNTENQTIECIFHPQEYLSLKSEKELALMELKSLLGVFFTKEALSTNSGLTARISFSKLKNLKRLTFWKKIVVNLNSDRKIIVPNQVYLEKSSYIIEEFRNGYLPLNIIKYLNSLNLGRKKKSTYLMHSLHQYKGKFYPQIVKGLLNTFNVQPGDRILDPFCGCGTTNFECFLLGVDSVGVDLNPLACFIARVRIQSLSIEPAELKTEILELLQKLRYKLKKVSIYGLSFSTANVDSQEDKLPPTPQIPNLDKWFAPRVIRHLLYIKKEINEVKKPLIRDLFRVVFSGIIKEASNWATSQIRPFIEKTQRKKVDVYAMFEKNLWKAYRIVRVFHALMDALKLECGTAEIFNADARSMNFLSDNEFDLILTSPPYANALPYLETDRLRSIFLGLFSWEELKRLRKKEIGNREIRPEEREVLKQELMSDEKTDFLPDEAKKLIRFVYLENKKLPDTAFRRKNRAALLYKYFKDMNLCLAEMSRVLKKNGHCIIIIGNNRVRAGNRWAEVKTDRFLKEMAIKNKYFKFEGEIAKELVHTAHPRKIKAESILFFKKL